MTEIWQKRQRHVEWINKINPCFSVVYSWKAGIPDTKVCNRSYQWHVLCIICFVEKEISDCLKYTLYHGTILPFPHFGNIGAFL